MTTLQTVAALEEFRARYGAPYWSAENEDQVLQDWDNVLKRYSVLDVRTACGELCAFGKLKTFPTIGHLAAYLKKGYQPEDNSRPEETKKTRSWTNWNNTVRAAYGAALMGGCVCLRTSMRPCAGQWQTLMRNIHRICPGLKDRLPR